MRLMPKHLKVAEIQSLTAKQTLDEILVERTYFGWMVMGLMWLAAVSIFNLVRAPVSTNYLYLLYIIVFIVAWACYDGLLFLRQYGRLKSRLAVLAPGL